MSGALDSIGQLIEEGKGEGWEALAWLASQGDYVYHGSWQKLEAIEPRQPFSYGKPDGDPAVCASEDFEVAIFRALINRHYDAAWNVKHASRFYRHQGISYFGATKASMDIARERGVVGYVHVMAKKSFEHYRGIEYRSSLAVSPLHVIAVHGQDLPENIEIITEQDLNISMEEQLKRHNSG